MPQEVRASSMRGDSPAASTGGWTLSQRITEPLRVEPGRNESREPDVITAVEYDRSGEYLATGSKGGQVVVYSKEAGSRKKELLRRTFQSQEVTKYAKYKSFQSHNAEFDYLKSLEIEEKINKIKWCRSSNNALYLLSTNDKTIKFWKLHDREVRESQRANKTYGDRITFPTMSVTDTVAVATPKRVFANAHTYHINSIALNSDGETFLSADDLRINLWHLGVSNQSFNIVDIKPNNMEELTEVITAADFHPSHCNIMMYSTSRGSVKLGDMRMSALCDSHARLFEDQEDPASRSFFSEIIASIADIKFSPDGRYIISRDYLTLKIWDVNMEARPVQTINIHEHLRPRLCELYDTDCIFDKFECAVSGDGNNFITGSYNSEFHIYDRYGRTDYCLNPMAHSGRRRSSAPHNAIARQLAGGSEPEALDYRSKVLQATWHPTQNEVAVAVRNSLFVYSTKPEPNSTPKPKLAK
ncbi:protein phosphatase PP2A regulatory subunit B [Achlya hypogyna]|uniref:Serine/threonine-protein phosphatase 2A 55 kDa regulatory subunit B n=1 Tax=Achlya hypogyna TaxID=1202772 RepID=A0A1V9ZML1_ACHHY|nr:protein phosphatase PP2A regulatory subunit B [Achlya hypogyna]